MSGGAGKGGLRRSGAAGGRYESRPTRGSCLVPASWGARQRLQQWWGRGRVFPGRQGGRRALGRVASGRGGVVSVSITSAQVVKGVGWHESGGVALYAILESRDRR